jgi:hypothetical protein
MHLRFPTGILLFAPRSYTPSLREEAACPKHAKTPAFPPACQEKPERIGPSEGRVAREECCVS